MSGINTKFLKIWESLDPDIQKRAFTAIKYKNSRRFIKNNPDLGILPEESKEFHQFVKSMEVSKSADWEHDRGYWFDESRDVYIVHLPSRKHPFAVPGETWRSMKESYSNWDDAPASINAMSRKFGLARRTVSELLRVMGCTHDSSPWTEEDLGKEPADGLVEDLLRRKEEKVLVTAQKKEWRKVKQDAEKYRRIDLLAKHLALRFENTQGNYDVPRLNLTRSKSPYSVVLSPTDFHWGKYGPAYGGAPYDRKIARARLWATTESVLSRVSLRGRPECIFLVIGGDGLHIDNMSKSTTRLTPQDVDGSPEELAWTYVEMCKEYVDLVRQFSKVHLFVIPGNHDAYTTVLLRAALKGWFFNVENVHVEESLNTRQYVLYGNSMLSFLHGDVGSAKDWPAIIANEKPKEWGQSRWRFLFTGHLHTERELPTFGGMTVYRMPSLAGNDSWHNKRGYSSRKALIAYLVSKTKGVISTEIEPVLED